MSRDQDRTHQILIRSIHHGSMLYGTQTPSSDVDARSIVLPSADDILLQGDLRGSRRSSTKDAGATRANTSDDVDSTTMTIGKYLDTLVEGDPSAVDVLFAPQWANIHEPHPIWETVDRGRRHLVSKAMLPRMLSYCRKRVGRYGMLGSAYNTKKVFLDWLESQEWPPRDQSIRLRTVIRKSHDSWRIRSYPGISLEQYESQRAFGRSDEIRLTVAGKIYDGSDFIIDVLESAEKRVKEHGQPVAAPVPGQDLVEWKILAHAVRTAQQAVELLETGALTFPRDNAAELVEIRMGQWTYASVENALVSTIAEAERLLNTTSLPAGPNQVWIDDLLRYAHRYALQEYFRD